MSLIGTVPTRSVFNWTVYKMYTDAYSIMLGLVYMNMGLEDWR